MHLDISEPCQQPTSASWVRNVGAELLLPGSQAGWLAHAALDPANSRLRICRVLAGLGICAVAHKVSVAECQDCPAITP